MRKRNFHSTKEPTGKGDANIVTLPSNKYHVRKMNFRNFIVYVNHSNDSNQFNDGIKSSVVILPKLNRFIKGVQKRKFS